MKRRRRLEDSKNSKNDKNNKGIGGAHAYTFTLINLMHQST